MQTLYGSHFKTANTSALCHEEKGRNTRKIELKSTTPDVTIRGAAATTVATIFSRSPFRDAGFRAFAITYSYEPISSLLLNEIGWCRMVPSPQLQEVGSSRILPQR